MAPWWAFNYHRYHDFVRLDLGAGWLLYAGNNALNKTGDGRRGVDFDETIFSRSGKNPIEHYRAMRDAAVGYIASDPLHFLHMAALKFGRFWSLTPNAAGYRSSLYVLASLLSFGPVLALSLLYFALRCPTNPKCRATREWRLVVPLLLLACYVTLVHSVFVGSIRYRLPIEPFMIVLAGVAVSRLYSWRKYAGAGLRRSGIMALSPQDFQQVGTHLRVAS